VLTANVEEARYRVLMSDEGENAHAGALRRSQQPKELRQDCASGGAVVWSASMSGKPVRPGQGPDGSLLFPLQKAPAGEDAPAFAIETCTWPGRGWSDKGRAR